MVTIMDLNALYEKHSAEPGTLYIVPTPLGNLSDLSLRSIRILETCDCIACETPNVTRKLLSVLNIHKELFVYRDAGEVKSAQNLYDKLQQGFSVSLVSDAGTPTISDPGFRVVKLCQENQIKVVPLPGANAVITALSASGFPSDRFLFLGFLPAKKGAKTRLLQEYGALQASLILYESPHRIESLFVCMQEAFQPQRKIFVARELTKMNECFYRGTLQDLSATFLNNPPKGEYVVLIAPEDF